MKAKRQNRAIDTLAFIGFGEAAMAVTSRIRPPGPQTILAFDIKAAPELPTRRQKIQDFQNMGVTGCDNPSQCVCSSQMVLSLVTPDQAIQAAKSAAPGICADSLYVDCNSCAPDTKKRAAKIITDAGARYVDLAIMAPVNADPDTIPVLISGPSARVAQPLLLTLGMQGDVVEGDIGSAAAIKLIRSVMVKGLEALVAECGLAGQKAGVAHAVWASLENSHPGFDWKNRMAYALERMTTHGKRRAAEMREVVLSFEQMGLKSEMTRAAALWQQTLGDLALPPGNAARPPQPEQILTALDKQENRRN